MTPRLALTIDVRRLRVLTIALLAAPNVVFLLGWLYLPWALVFTAALLLLVARGFTTARAGTEDVHFAVPLPAALGAGLLAVTWVALSGTGGVGLQNGDHWKHNAMLFDLVHERWPVVYAPHAPVMGETSPLVYYIASYLVPAGVGKLLGWAAANVTAGVQLVVVVGLVFLWLIRFVGARSTAGILLLVVYFVLASGLDFLARPQLPFKHLEWWTFAPYSANSTLLFWVPQHAAIGWLGAALLLDAVDEGLPVLYGAGVAALGILWSPYCVLGLLPLLVLLFVRTRGTDAARMRARDVVVLLVAALPFVLYMTEKSRHLQPDTFLRILPAARFAVEYAKLSIIEWGLPLLPVLLLPRFVRRGPALAGAVTALLLIPMQYAPGIVDFIMRASVPSLFVMWIVIASHVAAVGGHARPIGPWVRRGYLLLVTVIVVTGAMTPLFEIGRSVVWYELHTPVLAREPQVPRLQPDSVARQYVGRHGLFSAWLSRAPAATWGAP